VRWEREGERECEMGERETKRGRVRQRECEMGERDKEGESETEGV